MSQTGFSQLIDNLARSAVTTPSVKEAALTVRLGENTVRVGDYDITKVKAPHLHYDITCARTGNLMIDGIQLYDVSLKLVRLLNTGLAVQSRQVQSLLSDHFDFVNARNKAEYHRDRARYYADRGMFEREEVEMIKYDFYYDKSHRSHLNATA